VRLILLTWGPGEPVPSTGTNFPPVPSNGTNFPMYLQTVRISHNFPDITCPLPRGQGSLLKRIVDGSRFFEDVSESDGKSTADLCYEETVGRVCRQLAPRGITLHTHGFHFIKCIPYGNGILSDPSIEDQVPVRSFDVQRRLPTVGGLTYT
jgi:hypothetical protein